MVIPWPFATIDRTASIELVRRLICEIVSLTSSVVAALVGNLNLMSSFAIALNDTVDRSAMVLFPALLSQAGSKYTPSPAESDFDGLTAGFETIQLCL
jgi:hypothetical protein